MATFSKLIGIILILSGSCQAGSWYTKDPQGWLWYKRAPQKKVLDSHKAQPDKDNPKKPLSYSDRIKQVQENFEEVKAKAILEPSLENVSDFQRAQNAIFYQAEMFQKMLMIAAMMESNNPETVAMTSPASREISQRNREEKLEREIKQLAKQYGIFFLFKNDCPYCHQFAPVVRELIDKYGFEYKAISKDGLPSTGVPLKEFPEAVLDNGTIDKLNPEGIYPYLLLVNPQTREVIPLSKGLVNRDQLKENLSVIIQFLKGHQR